MWLIGLSWFILLELCVPSPSAAVPLGAAADAGMLEAAPAAALLLDEGLLDGMLLDAPVDGMLLDAGDDVADGAAVLAVLALFALFALFPLFDDALLGDGALAPEELAAPAAFSKSFRCERNSTSLPLMAGSIAVVPEVPTAPGVPEGAGVASTGAPSAPMSAVMLLFTLSNEARQSAFAVISSLKLAISCDTWVRASPVSCAAEGSCVSCASESRAAVRCRLATSSSS